MKRLLLVRHGKSSWKDPELSDFDRPPNRRGKEDAPAMGRRLAERGWLPALIITSPAKRAVSTMKRIAEEFGFPETGSVNRWPCISSRSLGASRHHRLPRVARFEAGLFHGGRELC